MQKYITQLRLLLFAPLAIVLAGCMLIGSGIGAMSDAQKPKEMIIPGWKVDTLRVGAKIEVIQRDGTTLSGYYHGLEAMSPDEYARLYAERLNRLPPDLHFPALQEQVQLTFAALKLGGPDVVLESRFQGFDPNAILFVALRQGNASTQKKSFYELSHLRMQNGNVIEGNTIRAVVRDGLLPVQSRLGIFVTDIQQKKWLPINEIQQLHQLSAPRKGALTGFILGATIDVAILVIGISSMDFTGTSIWGDEN